MKKLIILFLILTVNCQAQFPFTNIVVTTNVGFQEPIPVAFRKINTNFYYLTNYAAIMDFGQGTTETDGTFTNSFRWTYSNPPTVIAIQVGGNLSTTNAVTNVTTTNFIYRATKAGVVHNWFSVERIP